MRRATTTASIPQINNEPHLLKTTISTQVLNFVLSFRKEFYFNFLG